MKRLVFISCIVILSLRISAQDGKNLRLITIEMVGKSQKEIPILFIVDSVNKKDFSFDSRLVNEVQYSDSQTLQKIYDLFSTEKRFDSLTKYDYSFGTFIFSFLFEGKHEVNIIGSRVQSAVYFQQIICRISAMDMPNRKIIEQIDQRLRRINY